MKKLLVVLLVMTLGAANAGELLFGGVKLGTTKEVYNIGESNFLFVNPYLGLNISKNLSIESNFEFRDTETSTSNTLSSTVVSRGHVYRGTSSSRNGNTTINTGSFTVDNPMRELTYSGTLLLHLKF